MWGFNVRAQKNKENLMSNYNPQFGQRETRTRQNKQKTNLRQSKIKNGSQVQKNETILMIL